MRKAIRRLFKYFFTIITFQQLFLLYMYILFQAMISWKISITFVLLISIWIDYFPTGFFALLSLVSFSIDLQMVPGRLGLLVTLYLIMTNVYISVEGPKSRGFSYIEIWFVGMQIPIIFGIMEYAMLLTMKRNLPTRAVISDILQFTQEILMMIDLFHKKKKKKKNRLNLNQV